MVGSVEKVERYIASNLQKFINEEMIVLLNFLNYCDPRETFPYVNFISIQRHI